MQVNFAESGHYFYKLATTVPRLIVTMEECGESGESASVNAYQFQRMRFALSMCPSQTHCIHNVIGKLKPEQQDKFKKRSIYSRDLRRSRGFKKHAKLLIVPI